MRVLYFAGGYLWRKRLERGQFQVSHHDDKQAIDYSTWLMIVEGIALRSIRRLKRYRKPIRGSPFQSTDESEG